jgi:hypothetical protein
MTLKSNEIIGEWCGVLLELTKEASWSSILDYCDGQTKRMSLSTAVRYPGRLPVYFLIQGVVEFFSHARISAGILLGIFWLLLGAWAILR